MMEFRWSMWILAALPFFFVSTLGSEYYSRPDFSTHRRFHVPSSDEFSNSSQLVVRQPRTVNTKTDELLHKTSIVARIVNSIYLQASVLDKTVPVEDVVAELLNLGSTKVSEVASFDGKKVKDLMTKIKGFPGSIDATPDTLEMESFIIVYDVIRSQSQSVKSSNDLGTFSEYFTKLEAHKTKLSQANLDAVFEPFQKILQFLSDVKKIDSSATRNKAEHASAVNVLNVQLNKAIEAWPNIENIRKDMKELGDLSLDDLNPISIAADLLKHRMNIVVPSTGNYGVKNNEKMLTGLNPAASAAKSDVQRLLNLVSSRMNSNTVKRKYTTGFVRGISDMQKLSDDIKDTWLSEVFVEKGKVSKLEDGLKPLLKLKADATALSVKLDPISKKELLSSIQAVSRYIEEIGSVVSIADADIDQLITDLIECSKKGAVPKQTHISPAEDSLNKAKQLKEKFSNPPKIEVSKQSLEDFQSLFKNLPTELGQLADVAGAFVDSLKSNGKLADFENLITNGTRELNSFDYTSAVQSISTVLSTKTSYEDFQKHAIITAEILLYTCLHAMDDKVEKLAKGLKVKQHFQSLGTNEITMVENAITVIESLSTDFSKVKDLPNSMDKEVSDASQALQKLTEVKKMSETLGTAVKGLYSIQQFGEIEPSLTKLKDVGSDVDSEIGKLLDPQLKTSLQQKWGNHQTDMANVETVLGQVEQVEAGLDLANIKKLNDLGAPLASLSSVTDVSMKVGEKLEVLNTLISSSSDPAVTPKLNDAKGVLEPIDGLQLAFSSYQSGFSNSLGVLGAFESFLAPYLTQKHDTRPVGNNTVLQQVNNIITDSASASIYALVSLAMAIVVLVPATLAYIWFCKPMGKRWQYKKMKLFGKKRLTDKIPVIITSQYQTSEYTAAHCHATILRNMFEAFQKQEKPLLELDLHRYDDIECRNKAIVKLWNGPIPYIGKPTIVHANWITTYSGTRFIATQGPMKKNKGTNVNIEGDDGKLDTCEHFWQMVFTLKVEYIVMLCNFVETKKHKCGQYFPPLNKKEEYGSYLVETKSETNLIKDQNGKTDIIERKITVTKGGKSVDLMHYQYVTWPDMDAPRDPASAVKLMKLVGPSKKPIVVHCSAGIGRTGSFIGIKYVSEFFELEEQIDMTKPMTEIRKCRARAIQKWQQSYFVQVAVILYLTEVYELKESMYQQQLAMYQSTLSKPDGEYHLETALGKALLNDLEKMMKAIDGYKAADAKPAEGKTK